MRSPFLDLPSSISGRAGAEFSSSRLAIKVRVEISRARRAGNAGSPRSDNGPEFLAKAVQEWIAVVGAKTAYIERGSPWENGYIESFNARLRDELLDGEIFYTLREVNTIRPHASLRYKPPAPEVFVPAFAAWPAALGQPAGDDAEAVMLDFVQPHLPGGQRVSFGREAGGDEAGRKQTQHGSKHRCAAAKCESSEAEARGHSGRWGRAAPTPGQRGDDGYAGMPPRSNVDASPEARTLHRQWLAEG